MILITAHATVPTAVAALREGAFDYVQKPFDNEELRALVKRALEVTRLARENRYLRAELRTPLLARRRRRGEPARARGARAGAARGGEPQHGAGDGRERHRARSSWRAPSTTTASAWGAPSWR